jgi:molybdopterin/thiamine biosynthesis adenylyltransferase
VRARRAVPGGYEEGAYVVPGERLSPEDLGARIPKLAALREARIAEIGLGALGAPLALELARNQAGELRLLDGDSVEIAQTPRWPLGVPAAGRLKVNVLADAIEENYPYTRVGRFVHRLGQTALARHGRSENELDLLTRLLEDVSLVIDASAELRIQQLIADFATDAEIRQLYLSATEGARGGQVALVVPGAGGCWFCWRLHTMPDADGNRLIVPPPADTDGSVQPRGCALPTFTGASFDLLPVVAQAARVAAAAVGPTELSSTVWRLSLPEDDLDAAVWEAQSLPRHPECPICHPG